MNLAALREASNTFGPCSIDSGAANDDRGDQACDVEREALPGFLSLSASEF
jgi:hypothetical protein